MNAPIDPIHQLIEQPKTAVRAWDTSLNLLMDAEQSIPGSMSFQSNHP